MDCKYCEKYEDNSENCECVKSFIKQSKKDVMVQKKNCMKPINDMTLEEKIDLCMSHGYDIDGDVHNGEAFCVIPPTATLDERKQIYQMLLSRKCVDRNL